MSEIYGISNRASKRIRAFRKTRRITGEALASELTQAGYPITRSVLANVENGRFKTVSVDLVVAAMRVYGVTFNDFMSGPLCGTCDDAPPSGFVCQTCLRTTNTRGEVVAC
jgi:transcriptional regulator with XRE-family HTH domain